MSCYKILVSYAYSREGQESIDTSAGTCMPLLPSASAFSPSTSSPFCSSVRGGRSPPRPRPPRPLRPLPLPLPPRPPPPSSLPGTSIPLSLHSVHNLRQKQIDSLAPAANAQPSNTYTHSQTAAFRSESPVVLLHITILPVLSDHDLSAS